MSNPAHQGLRTSRQLITLTFAVAPQSLKHSLVPGPGSVASSVWLSRRLLPSQRRNERALAVARPMATNISLPVPDGESWMTLDGLPMFGPVNSPDQVAPS